MKYRSEVSIAIRRNMHESLQKALSRLHSSLIINSSIDKVVIKPSIYDPNLPGNTSLELVRSAIRMFQNVSDITIVESDTNVRTADDAFKALGLDQLASKHVSLVNLSKFPCSKHNMPGHFFKNTLLSDAITEKSLLINLATPKINPQSGYFSGAIKNLFGLLPEPNKDSFHQFLDDVLLDLLEHYRPRLTILELGDVIIGDRKMGQTYHIGGVIVGVDIVAVDSYCASLFKLEPPQIPLLRKAYELGLGEILPERIKELGTEYQIEKMKRLCFDAL